MRRRYRGFTLLELIVVLGLVAFVSIIATNLFRATLRTWRESAAAQQAQGRFDQAIGQFRRDVWSATSMELPNPRTAILQTPEGRVEWDAIDPAGLARVAAADPADHRRWEGLGDLTFSARGPTLVVRVKPSPQEAGGEMVLTSQPMLLAGRSR
ncbi:MAG TPA: type II secretion system protein [Tepidisphaeraceae bacterium]|jgi:prepilin-type N-terminal cleavage/methylation domain-containing protein